MNKIPLGLKKEEDLFYILEMIRKNPSSLCFTDYENYFVGRSKKGLPTWIWSKDGISKEKLQELKRVLEDNYLENELSDFTSKKEIYEVFSKEYETSHYFEMGFLEAFKLNDIPLSPGFMDHPSKTEKEFLVNCWEDNQKEMHPDYHGTREEIEQEVETWFDNDDFFVWRNPSGRIVCLAEFRLEGNKAKIGHVYTPPKDRRKGYCASLIYAVTKMLLEKNYRPLLYTDYHYEASNKAYQKVGYENKGILINYKMQKKKKRVEI